jgi:hypothetical protein
MINGNRNKFVYHPVARLLLSVDYNGYFKTFIVYLQVFSEPYRALLQIAEFLLLSKRVT